MDLCSNCGQTNASGIFSFFKVCEWPVSPALNNGPQDEMYWEELCVLMSHAVGSFVAGAVHVSYEKILIKSIIVLLVSPSYISTLLG